MAMENGQINSGFAIQKIQKKPCSWCFMGWGKHPEVFTISESPTTSISLGAYFNSIVLIRPFHQYTFNNEVSQPFLALLALRVGRLGELLQWPQFRKPDVLSVDMFLYFWRFTFYIFLPSGKFWTDKNIRSVKFSKGVRSVNFWVNLPQVLLCRRWNLRIGAWKLVVGGGCWASRFWDTLL